MRIIFFVLIGFNLAQLSYAADDLVLPEPLTLSAAKAFSLNNLHFSYASSDSQVKIAQATLTSVNSNNDVSVNVKGYLRKVGVSDVGDPDKDNDSKVSLFVTKNLYDFGLSSHQESVAKAQLLVAKLKQELVQEQHLIDVTSAYFNVLRADNSYLTNNEAMSLGFIGYDRAQERAEFGMSSDLDIIKAQTAYEIIRQKRYLSEANQRITRQHLAEILAVPDSPSDQLEVPKLDDKRKITNEVDLIIDLALKNSKLIRLQQAKMQAAQLAISLAENQVKPSLDAEFEMSQYARESPSRDDWRASINFNVPLFDGSRNSSKVSLARAQLLSSTADFQQIKSSTRLAVLQLWQEIQQKTVELAGAKIKQDYRDLYLEQSRADYELEYKSDLGDAMVEYSRSRSERYEIEFDLELAWQKLIVLVNESNYSQLLAASTQPQGL